MGRCGAVVAIFENGLDFARAFAHSDHRFKEEHVLFVFLARKKTGAKAEFWIELGGCFIPVRYFALRHDEGAYLGTLEVTQDLTRLRRTGWNSRHPSPVSPEA